MLNPAIIQQRLHNWCQTPTTHLSDVSAAPAFIERVGIATLYPASTEFPNLFSAYVGDPHAKTESGWSTPTGEVYTWRWKLGRDSAAFYTTLVRRRPTWIRWSLLPAILRLRGSTQAPADLYEAGHLSLPAFRIIQALESTSEALATSQLRELAGFPRGSSRSTYLKAVEELEGHLLLAKVFLPADDAMYHTLVSRQYPEQAAAATSLSLEDALAQVLQVYLPQALFANPKALAKDLSLPPATLSAAFERLLAAQQVAPITLPNNISGYLYTQNP